jgi:hypothetical protein
MVSVLRSSAITNMSKPSAQETMQALTKPTTTGSNAQTGIQRLPKPLFNKALL